MAATAKKVRAPYTAEEKARHKAQAAARKDAADALIAAHREEYEALLVDAKERHGVPDRVGLSDEERAILKAAKSLGLSVEEMERILLAATAAA